MADSLRSDGRDGRQCGRAAAPWSGSVVATISDASGSSRIWPAWMAFGSVMPLASMIAGIGRPNGVGDLAQRVAGLDLVEPRLGRRRWPATVVVVVVVWIGGRVALAAGSSSSEHAAAAATTRPDDGTRRAQRSRSHRRSVRCGSMRHHPASPAAASSSSPCGRRRRDLPGRPGAGPPVADRRRRHRPRCLRVGRRRRPAAALRPRRLRLRPHLRRVRPAARRRRLAGRSAGTSAATATATTPRCTRGTPTCATRSP